MSSTLPETHLSSGSVTACS